MPLLFECNKVRFSRAEAHIYTQGSHRLDKVLKNCGVYLILQLVNEESNMIAHILLNL